MSSTDVAVEKANIILEDNDDDYVTEDENSGASEEDVSDEPDATDIDFPFQPEDESIIERIYALRDIVAPSTRSNLFRTWRKTSKWISKGSRFAGNAIWIITTSAVLIGLPLAIAIENESMIVQQEKEFQQQQTGAQQLTNPFGSTSEAPKGLLPPGM